MYREPLVEPDFDKQFRAVLIRCGVSLIKYIYNDFHLQKNRSSEFCVELCDFCSIENIGEFEKICDLLKPHHK